MTDLPAAPHARTEFVQWQGLEHLRRVIANAIDVTKRPAPIYDILAGLLETQTRRRIVDTKTAPDGTAWAKWSAAYARTRGPSHSLLRDSDDMLKSIKHQHGIDFAEVFSDDIVYAGAQNYGYPPRNLPARRFLGVSETDAVELADAVADYLRQVIL